jgi:hypothetical protein
MPASPILSKGENYVLWQGGAFGNKLRAWPSLAEWRASGFGGVVVLRSRRAAGGGPTAYNLQPEEVEARAQEWIDNCFPRDSIMVNEAAPDTAAILQGEYRNDVYGFPPDEAFDYFRYTRVAKHMHVALGIKTEVATGLVARELVRLFMTPASHDDWLLLIDRYPGHVFEVSIYDRCLGDVPGRNALVWEIRRY